MIATAVFLLVTAASLCICRLILGPLVADRVVAADGMAIILSATMVLLSVRFQSSYFLDVVLVYAILSFVEVLLMAKYMEKGDLHS